MEVGTRVAALSAALSLVLQVAAGEILGLYAGDLCRMRCGSAGLCRSVELCPEAPEMVRQGYAPVMCSYNETTPVVCCPSARKANRMCSVYSSAVYQIEDPKNPNKYDQCVMKDVPFIVGGSPASVHEFPHMALLGYGRDRLDPRWDCGGSLISDHFVMTAAHCILTNRGAPKWVRLGDLDLTTSEESKHEDFDVVETFPHPDYKDGVHYNDIGLLKLDRQVSFTGAIRPACLHTLPEIGDKLGIASGWGFLNWADTVNSNTLQKLNLHLYRTEICNFAYRTQATTFRLRNGITEDTMVCAGSPEGGKDTCKGDSGGPLQVKLKSPYCMYSLIGITSFGKRECGSTTSPSVYTRVSHFVPWIEEIVWPEPDQTQQPDQVRLPLHEEQPDQRVHTDQTEQKQPEHEEHPAQKQPEHEEHPVQKQPEHEEHPVQKQPEHVEHPVQKQPEHVEHPVQKQPEHKEHPVQKQPEHGESIQQKHEHKDHPVQKQPVHEENLEQKHEHKDHPVQKQPVHEENLEQKHEHKEHPMKKPLENEEHPVTQPTGVIVKSSQQALQEKLEFLEKHYVSQAIPGYPPLWPTQMSVHNQQPAVSQPTWPPQGPYHVQPMYHGYQGYHGDQGYLGHQVYQGYPGHQGYNGHQGYHGHHGYQGHHGYHGHQGYHEPYHRQPTHLPQKRWPGSHYPSPVDGHGYFY